MATMKRLNRGDFNQRTFLVQEEPRGASQQIEIPVTAAGLSKVQFPDVPELRNQSDQTVIVKALRLVPATVLTNAPINGGTVAPLAELQKMSLVLYCEGWQKGYLIPILSLVDVFTEGSGIPWKNHTTQLANWENVDWNKCYIQYSNGQVSAGAPYVVLLEVEFLRLNGAGQEIIGPA